MDISEERREGYRRMSVTSSAAKTAAFSGKGPDPIHEINRPRLDPNELMPELKSNGLRTLSLFSGGGGLDLGFDRAGYCHVASYEIIDIAANSIKKNRPQWKVFGGDDGDVRKVDWKKYRGLIDIIHGGPPCQPFSIAGQQNGKHDERDMWPEFGRAIHAIKPKAFIAENVTGLLGKKFENYVKEIILDNLRDYKIVHFVVNASEFGIPQSRSRVFFVGFLDAQAAAKFNPPSPTHQYGKNKRQLNLFSTCMGAREALGLPNTGLDDLAPTIRSAFTGKRNTTSVLNSKASEKIWNALGLWPNGVQESREKARLFVAKNGDFRMSVKDVALLQGFPNDWDFEGAVYQILGQIGNSVSPVVAYNVACMVAKASIILGCEIHPYI